MTNIPGTNLSAGIVPFTSDDTYPTHYAMYGKGGHRTVQSIVNRNSIPTTLKEEGMTVFVLDDNTKYTWKKNPNNSNTVEWLSDANINAVGTNTQVIFNDNGVLAGNSDFTYDKSTKRLRILSYLDFRQDNLYLGNLAGNSNPNNSQNTQNVGIGYGSLQTLTNNALNVAVGSQTMSGSTDARGTVAIGSGALRNSNAQFSVAIGYEAGSSRPILDSYKLDIENSSRIDSLIEGDFSQRWVRFNGAVRKRVVNISGTSPIFQGTCTSNSITSGILDTSLNYTYSGVHVVIITGGTGKGQIRAVSSGSGNNINTLYSWDIPLDITSTYEVLLRNYIVTENYNSIYCVDLTTGNSPLLFSSSDSLGASVEVVILNNPNNKSLYLGNYTGSKFNINGVLKSDISTATKNIKHIFDVYGSNILYKALSIKILQPISTTTKDIQIDLNAEIYKLDVATATTVTLNINSSYIPILTNNALTIELHINMTAASLMTFPINVSWVGGSAPAFNAINKYAVVLRTMDAGTTWIANLAYTY